MNLNKIDTYIFYFLFALTGVLLISVAMSCETHYGGAESINHYFHSRAIFKHPEVLVNHWGKPLFIALSSGFAFFGERGVMIFNCIVMLLSTWVAFLLAKSFKITFAFPIVFFTIFLPVYYKFSQSCLTEPLFGLIAITSAYLFFKEKYVIATILISFIIFSRSEGMLFIPLYAFALIVRKQYRVVSFLFFGFIFYGIVGVVVGKDFFWYYTDFPYNNHNNYKTGPFWHWFVNHKNITGTTFSTYLVVSFITIMLYVSLYFKSLLSKTNLVLVFLILIPASVYIFGHSFLWYKGLAASIGELRIVGGVVVLLAFIVLFGMDILIKILPEFKNKNYLVILVLFFLSFLIVKETFHNRKSIVLDQPNGIEKLIAKSIKWIKESELQNRKMFVYQAHYIMEFNGDHFDREHSNIVEKVPNRHEPSQGLKKGDLFIWDSKTTPIEGNITKDQIDTTNFKHLITFNPEEKFKVFGDRFYSISIFEKK